MTTIAVKDGIIAYDSRMTKGTIIVSDKVDKRIIVNDVSFFFVGSTCDFDNFIKCYFGEKIENPLDCSAIVFDNGNLFFVGVDNKEPILYKDPMPFDIVDAMGSGDHFALMAMDCGFSAEVALQMVTKRDAGTGGIIRTFDMKPFMKEPTPGTLQIKEKTKKTKRKRSC